MIASQRFFLSVAIGAACLSGAAQDGIWTGGSGVWTNAAAWRDGVVPEAGATAAFTGAGGTVTVPTGYPFALSALLFNTNGATVAWTVAGETNALVGPAEVRVATNAATLACALSGSAGLTKTGEGTAELAVSNNVFSGKVSVLGGLLRARCDGSLGAAPETVVPDALTLNGGGLGNTLEALTVGPQRGITVGPNGGWFLARYWMPTVIEAPVTGPGPVLITRQSDAVTFSNPANDYAGDTVLGADGVGFWSDVNARGVLRLGADEVIPHGAGKGRLFFDGFRRGVLDLNGKSETVNTLAELGGLCLSNSAALPGVLRAGYDDGDLTVAGEIQRGATLEKIGAGTLHFSDNGRSRGGLSVSEGTLVFSRASALGELTVRLDGGGLSMTDTQPGLAESVAGLSGAAINLSVPMAESGVSRGTVKGFAGANGFADNTQFGYSGQWHVPQAGTYSFAKCFDDGAYLAVDGNVLLNNSTHDALVVTQNVALSAGWHAVDVRFSNGTGGTGPRNNFAAGILFDPNNTSLSNAADIAAAYRFEDAGDGSVLRTTPLGTATHTVRACLELAQDGGLDRSGTAASLVWAGGVIRAADAAGSPVLTVTGGAEPFRVGSTNRSAVFGADVADANGVRFQDKVWLLSLPTSSAWSIAAGADVAFGTAGILGTGPRTLTEYSVRLPSSDALGAGGETVTVEGTGRTVWFDATRETDGRLIDDEAYGFVASNNVVFNGTNARMGFDGAGTVTYAGTVSGNGALVKTGSGTAVLTAANTFAGDVQVNAGRLLVGDDAQLGDSANTVYLSGGYLGSASGAPLSLARTVQASAGGFSVEAGQLLTLAGTVGGTAAKTGGGLLSLEGAAANAALDLAVDQGEVVLNKSGVPAVRHILRVGTQAQVRLAGSGGNQIGGHVALTGGTLSLDGNSESVGQLSSVTAGSTVTNGGSAAVVLTVGEGNASSVFMGTLGDGASPLALTKVGSGNLSLVGGAGPSRYAGETRVEGGSLTWGAGVRYVRFTVAQTRTAGQAPAMSELQLMLKGEIAAYPADVLIYATSSNGPTGGPDRLIDANTVTKWLASAANGQYVRIDLRRPMAVDGYRWYTANDAAERDPVSWKVEVSTDNATWFTVDERSGETVTATRTMLAGTWPFSAPFAGAYAASPLSAVTVVSNATAQVYSPRESVAALAGAGTLAFVKGQTLSVSDASLFTGRVSGEGRLVLQGEDGSTLALQEGCTGLELVNGGSGALAVRLGGVTNGAFSAAVRDGTSPAGLVKVGPQTTVLYGSSSSYSGDTRVEAGTLAVAPGTLAYRYVRFSPTEVRAGTLSTSRVSMCEFQLVRGGAVVPYPAGSAASSGAFLSGYPAAKAIDGITGSGGSGDPSRWIGTALPNWILIDMTQPVAFDGYQYYTASSPTYDNPRDPVSWRFEGSHDGVNWVLLDTRVKENVPDIRANLVGPYLLGGAAPVPPAFWAATNSLNEKVEAVTARYLRFNPTRMRLESYEYAYTGFQIAELQLLTNGIPVPYPAGTSATAPGGGLNAPPNVLLPISAVDNILPTEVENNRWFSTSMVNPLTVDMGQPVTFDGYRWYTANNGAARDPLSWTLEISNDATNWYLVDVQTNWWGTLTRKAVAGEWSLNLPARGGALSCAIPDASRTLVAAGAVLRLDGAAETVGPLSGTGTVALISGAVLGIQAFEDAVFDGGLTGTGRVAVVGGGRQTFRGGSLAFKGELAVSGAGLGLEGATLSGVTNLVLGTAGAVEGTASVQGSLAVTFAGGAYGARLDLTGALAVSGAVAYVLPEGAALPYSQTLFTFASTDASSRQALVDGAASLSVPAGYVANVRVTETEATLSVTAPGTLMLVK